MMKKNMFKLQQVFFAVLVAGAMVSCQKEDIPTVEPEFTPEEQAEMAAADKFAAANSVYRALALINELPDVTLRDLFYHVVRQTAGSHASLYNYKNYGNIYTERLGEMVCREAK